jgi:hypothetical protein
MRLVPTAAFNRIARLLCPAREIPARAERDGLALALARFLCSYGGMSGGGGGEAATSVDPDRRAEVEAARVTERLTVRAHTTA